MALGTTLYRYRMSVALAVALLGPALLGLAFGLAGMTSPAELNTLVTMIVWAVGAWALGTAVWELWRGWQRYRGDDGRDVDGDGALA